MKPNRLTKILLASFTLLCTSSLHAESYYASKLQDLAFTPDQKDRIEATALMISRRTQMIPVNIRIPETAGIACIAYLPAGERQNWNQQINQGTLQVAFKLKDNTPQQGTVDLWTTQKKLQGFTFTIDPTKVKSCTKEEFEKISQLQYQEWSNEHLPGTAWFRHLSGTPAAENRRNRWRSTTSLNDTFAIFSGGRAISENLALDRNLILAAGNEKKPKPDVALKDIEGVTVKAIDWSNKLPKEDIKIDALAHSIPINQHALFAPSLKDLFTLMDQIETEGAPVLQAFTVRNAFRTLPSQYKRQMGLDVPEMVAKLLPIQSVAITGGDPFFPMGTDVAVLFETANPEALFTALTKTIALKAKHQGAQPIPNKSLNGKIAYKAYQTPDRRFSCHILQQGKLVAVSNSIEQIKRLLNVQTQPKNSLGASDEFRFFRHRYPISKDESAFIFLSDATIRRWASPKIRIGASRRTRGAAVLSELTSAHIAGEKPSDEFASLIGSTTLDGKKVISSQLGSLGFLTPVSEMEITTATAAEAAAYQQWRRGYENGWAQVFDPIAIRMSLGKDKQELDITVLPLTVDSDYREVITLTGKSSLSDKAKDVPAESLLYAAFAIDSKSETFKEFDQELLEMLPGLKINPLSWVGESISFHLENGFFWKAMQHAEMDENLIGLLPLAVRIESNSRIKLALFLTAMKGMLDTSAPDLVRWEKRKHGNQSYLAIIGDEQELNGMALSIYYAALPSALLVSLDEDMLKRAIDREVQDTAQGSKLPDAKHFLLESSPQFMMGLNHLFDQRSFEQRRQKESWRAIPILNEWHRRFPNMKPETVHQIAYASDLHCPGGKGYRWNAEAITMESVAYGHPTEPRNEGTTLEFINKFNKLQTTFGFEDGGLRIRAKLKNQKKAKPANKVISKPGKILATAQELLPQTLGTTWTVKETMPDGELRTIQSKLVKSEAGRSVTEHFITDSQGNKSKRSDTLQRKKEGDYVMHVQENDYEVNFHQGYQRLPAKLIQGESIQTTHSATITKNNSNSKLFFETQLEPVGLESITVPAGQFNNCVKVERTTFEIFDGQLIKRKSTEWYAKGYGSVKIISSFNGKTSTTELISKTDPKK